MTKISIDKAAYEASLGEANSANSDLEAKKITATHIDGTTLRPFKDLMKAENKLDKTVQKFSKFLVNDTKQYKKAEEKIEKTDTKTSQSFG